MLNQLFLVEDELMLGIYNPTNNSSTYLKALFNDDDLVTYDEFPQNNVQIGQLKDYQCIFLLSNEQVSSGLKSELISFVDQGGSLVMIPNRTNSFDDYNSLLAGLQGNTVTAYDTSSLGISEINYADELYDQVFKKQEADANLPVIHGFYRFSEQIRKIETSLLKFRNGKNALSAHRFGNGKVYSFAFPVDKENFDFIRHILFVPTIYNMVLNSEAPQKYVYPIESNEPVTLDQPQLAEDLRLVNHQTAEEFKVTTRNSGAGRKQIILDDIINEAGHYLVYNDQEPVQSISCNYPREESDPEFLSPEAIGDQISANNLDHMQLIDAQEGNFSQVLQELNNGKQLWKLFIILAISFLFVEMAVIQFWK